MPGLTLELRLGNAGCRAVRVGFEGNDPDWRIGSGVARASTLLMRRKACIQVVGDTGVVGTALAFQKIEVPGH